MSHDSERDARDLFHNHSDDVILLSSRWTSAEASFPAPGLDSMKHIHDLYELVVAAALGLLSSSISQKFPILGVSRLDTRTDPKC